MLIVIDLEAHDWPSFVRLGFFGINNCYIVFLNRKMKSEEKKNRVFGKPNNGDNDLQSSEGVDRGDSF